MVTNGSNKRAIEGREEDEGRNFWALSLSWLPSGSKQGGRRIRTKKKNERNEKEKEEERVEKKEMNREGRKRIKCGRDLREFTAAMEEKEEDRAGEKHI